MDINNKKSTLQNGGVPQAIKFGPILINLVYNELQISDATGHLNKYADDITPINRVSFNEPDKIEAFIGAQPDVKATF